MRGRQFFTAIALAFLIGGIAWANTPDFVLIPHNGSSGNSISGDGTVVGGMYNGTAFTWTAAGGLVDLGGNGGHVTVSNDGQHVSGMIVDGNGFDNAGLWQGGTSWLPLGGIGGSSGTSMSTNYAISGDGSSVVGLAWVNAGTAHAFQWTQSTGMIDLFSLGGDSSRANGISADGTTIVGWDQDPGTGWWRGAMWVNGTEYLIDPNGVAGDAWGVNSDGTFIVGGSHPSNSEHAWRWSKATGQFDDLGTFGGWLANSEGRAVSDDGSVVVGWSGGFMDEYAFIWTEASGTQMVKLSDYLTKYGVTGHQGYTLRFATGISDDGTVIVGTCQDMSWNQYAFVATIPPQGPWVDVKVNGENSGVVVPQATPVVLTAEVEASTGAGTGYDVWIAALAGTNSYFTFGNSSTWNNGLQNVYYSGPLVNINVTPLNRTLPVGSYKAWIGLDSMANGVLDFGALTHVDMVDFQVVP
jgi:probable HAF family extracellular repeat protein